VTVVLRGRGVRVEIAAGYASAIPIASISNAKPGVVQTSSSHGLIEGRAGVFASVAGMTQIDGQAVQIDAPSSSAFDVGVDTSPYGPFVSGSFLPVASWQTLAEATSYTISVGAAQTVDATRVDDIMPRQQRGMLGGYSIALNLLGMSGYSAAFDLIEDAANRGASVVLRITHPDGAVRIANGIPGLAGEDLQLGAIGTSTVAFSVNGYVARRQPKLLASQYHPPVPPPPPPDAINTYHPPVPPEPSDPPIQIHPLPPGATPAPPPPHPQPVQTYTVDSSYFTSDYVA
jgi:hypothetical protein